MEEVNSPPNAPNSKTKNFAGYFDVSAGELQMLMYELEDARKNGVELDQLLEEVKGCR
ncbi:hypothetical protein [Thermococcus sp. JdF3]|uniref:hypothetical protein n=1 Tax=Thermococcus sp. JdF3 TaxID=1638258 RepID=UPI00143AF42D|nr:hypothetical protein [Thermococcus sp. JdF3]